MATPQLFTSASEDHYTPQDIAERCRFALGGTIDLDPASSANANRTIKATRYYCDPFAKDEATIRDVMYTPGVEASGLERSWHASTLFLNPPFSVPARDASGAIVTNASGKPKRERVIDQWVKRWIDATTPIRARPPTPLAYDGESEVDQAILLVPARTDTQWFAPLWSERYTLAFIAGRLHFNEADNGATFPSVLVYFGASPLRFYSIFEDIAAVGKLRRI